MKKEASARPLEDFREAVLTPKVRLRVHDDYSILSMVEHELGVSILAGTGAVKNKLLYCD